MYIDLHPGNRITVNGKEWVIEHIVDLSTLVGQDPDTGEKQLINVSDIEGAVSNNPSSPDLMTISEKDWAMAQNRYEAIAPLLGDTARVVAEVDAAAKRMRVSRSTIYRWIERYQTTGTVQALVPQVRGGAGDRRLSDEVEQVIKHIIQTTWLHKRKVNAQIVVERIQSECRKQGLTSPHPNTIRNRLRSVPANIRVKRREGRKAAEKYEPAEGEFPDADYPLQVVQIDHTPLDIEIVDSIYRLSIGRPWITVGIDVFSRMVTGLFVSLEPPSALSVGLVIAHSINRKEEWLSQRGIEAEWPVWGKPTAIHADNAGEFRGEIVTRACQNHGIDIHWRPVAKPEFGAHVERWLGTLNVRMSSLPGRTGRSIEARGAYDSSKKAAFTLDELENYLGTYLCEVYHRRLHKSISMSPLKAYTDGIHGTPEKPGRGLPPMPADPERLRIDFLPYYERTVQPKGIVINHVYYYAQGLRKWINAADEKSGRNRKFIVRRDPRSTSKAWFLDPDTNDYIELRYANLSRPDASEWELREARRRLEAKGRKYIDEDAIFDSLDKLRQMEEHAVSQTRSTRRKHQRRKSGSDLVRKTTPGTPKTDPNDSPYERPKIEITDDYEPVKPLDFEDADV